MAVIANPRVASDVAVLNPVPVLSCCAPMCRRQRQLCHATRELSATLRNYANDLPGASCASMAWSSGFHCILLSA